MAFKRLPNGVGTVTKEKGKRRNPWRAMKPIGRKVGASGKPYTVYQRIGSYPTRTEAIKALMDASDMKGREGITFEEVFLKWKETRKKPWNQTLEGAYQHLKPLHHRKIRDIKTLDLEFVINNTGIARTMRNVSALILYGVYDYALRHEFVDKDYSKLAAFDFDTKVRIERQVVTKEEIEEYWKHADEFYYRCLLVLLYTGMRVSELGAIRPEDVFLDKGYMIGGMKTDAGKNRIIPIHPDIVPLIKLQMEYATSRVFVSEKQAVLSVQNLHWFISHHDIPHTPHDTRHTFASQAYICGMEEPILKRILGHKLDGVTQQVYIHLEPEHLVAEMRKFHY